MNSRTVYCLRLYGTYGPETPQPCFCYFQVTYSKEGEDAEEQPLRDKLMSSVDSEVLAYDNYQSYNDAVFGLNPEPPRALPSSEGQETRVYILGNSDRQTFSYFSSALKSKNSRKVNLS